MLVFASFFSMSSEAQNSYGGGYRGLLDLGYIVGIGDYDFNRYELNTSHGYQFNSYLFLGVGTGLHYMSKYETAGSTIALDQRKATTDIPVFANIKCNMGKSKYAPFIDLKGGKYLTNNGGLYANISAGLRIATNERSAVNFSVGYTLQELEFETFNRFLGSSSMAYSREGRVLETEGITIKLGYEF